MDEHQGEVMCVLELKVSTAQALFKLLKDTSLEDENLILLRAELELGLS